MRGVQRSLGRPHPGKRSSGTRPPAPGPSFARLPLLRSRRTRAALPASSILLIAVLGAAHILVRTSTYGAAVEWDSVAYLSAAESLAAGDGLTRPGSGAFMLWPPLFPMLLALLVPFGLEPVDSARFVNVLAFGLTIALAGFWLGRNLDSRLLALAGTVAVATAVPLCDIFSYVMTEPLFILFTLLALTGLESFLNRTDAAMPALALGAGWAALAAVTRYLGVVVILVGVLLVFLAPTRRDLSAAARLKHAAVYGAISSFPLALVLAHNWSVSGTLAGDRIGSGQSLFDSLGQVGEIFWQWIFVSTNAPNEALVWALAGLAVLGISVVVAVRHAASSPPPPPQFRASHPARVRDILHGVSCVSPRRLAVDDPTANTQQISHAAPCADPVDGRVSAGQVAAPRSPKRDGRVQAGARFTPADGRPGPCRSPCADELRVDRQSTGTRLHRLDLQHRVLGRVRGCRLREGEHERGSLTTATSPTRSPG